MNNMAVNGEDRGTRMRCDYCRKVVVKDSPKSIPCTACGHGNLKKMEPRNWCCLCGEPQYDNVSKLPVQVECARCVDRKVEAVRKLEADLCVDLVNTDDMRRAIANEDKRGDGEELKAWRNNKGWSQSDLGIHLGVSREMIAQMENGAKPLTREACNLIGRDFRFKRSRNALKRKTIYPATLPLTPSKCNPDVAESKQVKNQKIEGHGPFRVDFGTGGLNGPVLGAKGEHPCH